jgi:hypothetical protein
MHPFYYYAGIISYAMHLFLPDYDHRSWLAWRWLGLFCLFCLVLFQIANRFDFMKLKGAFWLILAFMKIYTLLALRDVLTQSFFLVCYCLLFAIYHFRSHVHLAFSVLRANILLLTGGLYLLAGIHKVNEGFLFSDQSCAIHGVDVVVDYFSMPNILKTFASQWMIGPFKVVGIFVIIWEFALGYLVLRQSLIAILIAIPFHLPLTLTIAPAFGLVMLGGLIFCFTDEQINQLEEWYQDQRLSIKSFFVWALIALIASVSCLFLLIQKWPNVLSFLKVCLYFFSLFLASLFLALRFLGQPKLLDLPNQKTAKWISLPQIIPIFFILHGLTFPYLGIEMQHSGAMLSNLRIDPNCHNSLIFPKRSQDPYLYLDVVRFANIQTGEPAQRAKIMQETLWHWAALHTMKHNWCGSALEPIYLEGHYQGKIFKIENLCEPEALDRLSQRLGRQWWELPQWQRFQKNLTKNCHEACVH